MKHVIFLSILCLILSLFFIGCSNDHSTISSTYDIPSRDHDLSYIPFDIKFDNPDFNICDSTSIRSGRNTLIYTGGKNKFRQDVVSDYLYKTDYKHFSGYIVIRFLINCKGESGRFRTQSLNMDFTPLKAPSGLLKHSIELVKGLDHWTKSTVYDSNTEYSKFINLKIKNGKIEHVVL